MHLSPTWRSLSGGVWGQPPVEDRKREARAQFLLHAINRAAWPCKQTSSHTCFRASAVSGLWRAASSSGGFLQRGFSSSSSIKENTTFLHSSRVLVFTLLQFYLNSGSAPIALLGKPLLARALSDLGGAGSRPCPLQQSPGSR